MRGVGTGRSVATISGQSVIDDAGSLCNVHQLPSPVKVMLPDGTSTLAQQAGEITQVGWADGRPAELTIHNILLVEKGC